MSTGRQRIYNRRTTSAGTEAGPRRAVVPGHKYKVGQEVRYLRSPGERASREIEKSLFAASFTVSRLLPASGAELQYRLKNTATGQERIASEAEISPVEID